MAKINQRREDIRKLVQQSGYVTIEALAKKFDVTPQTIRRDINEMATAGILERYHGGAGWTTSTENISYGMRQKMGHEGKREIGQLVAQDIGDGTSLFINIGTTTEQVAKALNDHRNLRVITNNLNVASICAANPEFEVIIAGGVVRARDLGVIGEATIDFMDQFKVDVGIIGISGIDVDGSLLDFDYREVRVAQAIIRNSRKVYLCADQSKFGRRAMVRLGHISDIDVLYTDSLPEGNWRRLLMDAGVEMREALESMPVPQSANY